MNIDNLIVSLHPLERKVLKFLPKSNNADDLIRISGMQQVEVLRALMWLKNKNVISVKEEITEKAVLDKNGEIYSSKIKQKNRGLPEYDVLAVLSSVGKLQLKEIKGQAKISDEELSVSIGILKKKGAIELKSGILSITEKGIELQKKEKPEEEFLRKFFDNHEIEIQKLSQQEKSILEDLRKRKEIIKLVSHKKISYELTKLGREVLKKGIPEKEAIDTLTPQIIKSGAWKGKTFRKYDIKAVVPRVFPGRKQHYRRFIEEVREKFLALGFTEMTGPIVETEFWNMDALFMPQFHSARDIHDAYYIREPEYASKTELPVKVVENVRKAHESGFDTGSSGWKYKFDVKRTYRHVLRTQDTSISPRTLCSQELKIPGKYFQIVRCFRYDVIDATHLPDFNQTGGFVVEEGLTLRHLFGLLRLFAKEFADADKIKVVPAYFPFTEPSAALYAKHPEMGWLELAGAGMFRPEMTAPLGIKVPVIAWGVGLERVAMFKLGLKDIRQLFSHDLEFLRSARMI